MYLTSKKLLSALCPALKRNGILLVAVPFTGSLHQVPHDYYRYTHFALAKLAQGLSLDTVRLEAVYAPHPLACVMLDNLENSWKSRGRITHLLKTVLFGLVRLELRIARRLVPVCEPQGVESNLDLSVDDDRKINSLPIGFQATFRKATVR